MLLHGVQLRIFLCSVAMVTHDHNGAAVIDPGLLKPLKILREEEDGAFNAALIGGVLHHVEIPVISDGHMGAVQMYDLGHGALTQGYGVFILNIAVKAHIGPVIIVAAVITAVGLVFVLTAQQIIAEELQVPGGVFHRPHLQHQLCHKAL